MERFSVVTIITSRDISAERERERERINRCKHLLILYSFFFISGALLYLTKHDPQSRIYDKSFFKVTFTETKS